MILPERGDLIISWEPGDGMSVKGALPYFITKTDAPRPGDMQLGYLLDVEYIDTDGQWYAEAVFKKDVVSIMRNGVILPQHPEVSDER